MPNSSTVSAAPNKSQTPVPAGMFTEDQVKALIRQAVSGAQADRGRDVHPVDPEYCPDTRDAGTFDRKASSVTAVLDVNPDSTIPSGSGKSFKLGTGGGKVPNAPKGEVWRYTITVTRDKNPKARDVE